MTGASPEGGLVMPSIYYEDRVKLCPPDPEPEPPSLREKLLAVLQLGLYVVVVWSVLCLSLGRDR